MRQFYTADELAAAEALLMLAGHKFQPIIRSNTSIDTSQSQQQQFEVTASVMVTSTPYPKPPKKRLYKFIEELKTVTKEEYLNLSPVSNGNAIITTAVEPKINSTPSTSKKTNSGRIIKRTRRFISQSDDEVDGHSSERKLSTPRRKTKSTMDEPMMKSVEEDNKGIIHQAKKLKIDSACQEEELKNKSENSSGSSSNSGGGGGGGSSSNKNNKNNKNTIIRNISAAKPKHDFFNINIMESIQSDKVRHSRLFEAAYELGHCTNPDAIVDFQYRAIENLKTYKFEIGAKRRQLSLKRSTKAIEWMNKFRSIRNRETVCNDFKAKFTSTTCNEWKPFSEDAKRLADISNYNEKQMTRKPFIDFWTDEFLTQNGGKDKARSSLIEILKVLPNRSEVRHDFFNGQLPKLVASYKQTIKKNRRVAVRNEIADDSKRDESGEPNA